MIEIYFYKFDTKEHKDIVESKLSSAKKKKALENYIKDKGTKVSIMEYLNDYNRKNIYKSGYAYECFGESENCVEELVLAEFGKSNTLSYTNIPWEDVTEDRISYNDLVSYANALTSFIYLFKHEIACGQLKYV